jgi:hypothetical protein
VSSAVSSLASVVRVDLRSLAVLRVGLALTIVLDLVDRARFMGEHYTDRGVFPRFAVAAGQGPTQWSLHLATGNAAGEGVLFLIAGVFALLLLVGWKTRVVTVVSWIFVVSLANRTWPVNYGADAVLRSLLFFAMFLPLGARWSLDALFSTTPPPPDQLRSVASFGLTGQMASMYFFTGLQKLGDESWQKLNAVFYGFSTDHHATALGLWLAQFYGLTRFLTAATLILEIVVPVFVFVPIGWLRARIALLVCFIGFHVVSALCLHIGYFPWISILGWLALLPAEAWERAGVVTRPGVVVEKPRVAALLASVGIALGFSTSVINAMHKPSTPGWLFGAAKAVGMEQRWNMFVKPLVDGWFIVDAHLASGAEIDILKKNAPVSWTKPDVVADQFKSMRWRKYLVDMSIDKPNEDKVRALFLRWVCRTWNRFVDDDEMRMRSVELIFMQEDDLIGGGHAPVKRRYLASRSCIAQRNVPDDSAEYFERKPPRDDDDEEPSPPALDVDGGPLPADDEAPGDDVRPSDLPTAADDAIDDGAAPP